MEFLTNDVDPAVIQFPRTREHREAVAEEFEKVISPLHFISIKLSKIEDDTWQIKHILNNLLVIYNLLIIICKLDKYWISIKTNTVKNIMT